MSRSYKKNNWVKGAYYGGESGKLGKQAANRKVRRTRLEESPQPSWYRRVFNPYDIYDFCFPGRPQDRRK